MKRHARGTDLRSLCGPDDSRIAVVWFTLAITRLLTSGFVVVMVAVLVVPDVEVIMGVRMLVANVKVEMVEPGERNQTEDHGRYRDQDRWPRDTCKIARMHH